MIGKLNREQYFEHYLELKCTFSMTVNVDITLLIKKVHQKGIKFYPTFIYIISRIINKHKEFRTCFNDEGVFRLLGGNDPELYNLS